MKIHRVKCLANWFSKVTTSLEPFEVFRNDRHYEVGDLIELNETCSGEDTGRAALYRVTSVLSDADFPEGIKRGFAVIGIQSITGIYNDD